jgi:hypothetical protein
MSQTESWNRRDWLQWSQRGLGATALLALLAQDGVLGKPSGMGHPGLGEPRRGGPIAKRAIQICLVGGLSHLDSLDYKPELEKLHGKTLQTQEKPDIFFGQMGLLRKSDWEFRPRGQSGLQISELFPNIAAQADRLTVLRSMVTESANHTPALFFQNSGFEFNGFPSVGSWLSYGLGSIAEDLPAYVVLPDGRGGPNGGASNWTHGFLPGQHQGVVFQSSGPPVRDLRPARDISDQEDRATWAMVQMLNRGHHKQHGTEDLLAARIESYALAAKMQMSVPEVADLNQESQRTQDLYGLGNPETSDMGRRCLLGRRLLEKGVRFVQLYSGGPIAGTPRTSWDAHENVLENHAAEARRIDQPIAALLEDLASRGMLEDTLVLFTTEFGRTPFSQSAADIAGPGRDHNRYAFSCWMAGAGLQPGIAYGQSDDIGWKVASDPVTWHDFHATVLHLFGIDHTELTYYHNGIHRRLTNVHGEVIGGVLKKS